MKMFLMQPLSGFTNCFLHLYDVFGVITSSSLHDFLAHCQTGLVTLCVLTLSYQLRPASSQGLLFFFGIDMHLP